jgi:hypothetical protein
MPAAAGSSSEYNAGEHGCPRPTPAAKGRLEWYLGRAGVGRDAVGEAFPGMLLAMLSQPCFDKTCRGRCGRPQQSKMKNSAWLVTHVEGVFSLIGVLEDAVEEAFWPAGWQSKNVDEKAKYLRAMITTLQKAGCFGVPEKDGTTATLSPLDDSGKIVAGHVVFVDSVGVFAGQAVDHRL